MQQLGPVPDNLMSKGGGDMSGMQAGVQYMPLIVPADAVPQGAVTIGTLDQSQLPNAAAHISQMQGQMPGMGGPQMMQGPGGAPDGWVDSGQRQGARPARGRSPQHRGRSGPSMQQGYNPYSGLAPPDQER